MSLTLQQSPSFFRWNEHVHSGYRPAGKSASWYASSVFAWHTETCNVWSHLIGFFVFVRFHVFASRDVALATDSDDNYLWNLFSMRIFTVCVCLMYASSVVFHLFWPKSERVCRRCEKVDYCGIVLAIAGTGAPLILLVLRPSMTIVQCYWAVTALVSARAMFLLVRNVYSTESGLCIFLSVAWFLPVVGAHGTVVHGVFGSRMASLFYPATAIGALYLVGSYVDAKHIPERLYPGKFDTFGNSHNIMHACVLLATLMHWNLFMDNQ